MLLLSLQVPVVVVTSFPDAVPEALDAVLKNIKEHKYNVVLGKDLTVEAQLSREESALVGPQPLHAAILGAIPPACATRWVLGTFAWIASIHPRLFFALCAGRLLLGAAV